MNALLASLAVVVAPSEELVRQVRAHGMRPMITLDHFVYPGWVADRGGWSDEGTVDSWLANAERVDA